MKIKTIVMTMLSGLLLAACSGVNAEKAATAAFPQTFVFECDRNYAFTARIEGGQAWLFLPGKTIGLSPAASGSDVTYSDGKIVFWNKGDTARLEIGTHVKHACRNNRYLAIWEHAKLNGVDFRATGNEPGWYLEVSKDRKLLFVSDYGQRRHEFDTPEPESEAGGRKTVYRARQNGNSLEVIILGQPCRDTMRGDSLESTVTVTLDGRTYHGCGKALH